MDKYLSKCRTCLIRNGTVSILHNKDGKTLRDIMSSFIIEISDTDVMPQHICSICSRTIIKLQNFKRICEKSDRLLRELLKTTFQNDKHSNQLMGNDVKENIVDGQLNINKKCPRLHDTKIKTSKKKDRKKSSKQQLVTRKNQKIKEKNLPNNIKSTSEDEKCRTNSDFILENENCMEYCTSGESNIKQVVNDGTLHNDMGGSVIQSEHTAKCQDNQNMKEDNNRITLEEPVSSAPVTVPKKKRRLRKYLCASCGYAANDRCSLRVHTRLHTGEKPYACTQCERRFAVKANLNSHIQIHSGSRRFVCEICGRSFAAAASLRGHAHTHTGARPYVCKICSRAFASASNLRAHTRTHSDERPYNCDVCSRAFKSSSELHQHKRRHTGARPHACAQCARSFALLSNLRAHARTHAPAEHSCMHCDRTFSCKAALSAHQRVHSDGRFACEHCRKRFSRKTTLKTHYKTHKNSTINIKDQLLIGSVFDHNTWENTRTIEENIVQPSNSKNSDQQIILNNHQERISTPKLHNIQKKTKKIRRSVKTIDASNSLRQNKKQTKVKKNTTKNKNHFKINILECKRKKNIESKVICIKKSEESNATTNLIVTPPIGSFPITSLIRMLPIRTCNAAQQKTLATPFRIINLQKLEIRSMDNNRMHNSEVCNENGVRFLNIQTPEGIRMVSNQIPSSYIPILNTEQHSRDNLPCFLPATNDLIETNELHTNSNQNNTQTIQIGIEKTE